MPESIRDIDAVVFDRIWRVITEIGLAERHFNTLQQAYRALASTWLLGTVGAAGYVLEKFLGPPTEKLPPSIWVPILLSAIGIAGGLGILLLWNLDLLVYQRLLDSNFVEGLRLEKDFSWLPPIRRNMMAVHNNQGIMPKVVWFYSASSSILLFPVSLSLFYCGQGYAWNYSTQASTAYFALILTIQVFMIRKTRRIDFSLDDELLSTSR